MIGRLRPWLPALLWGALIFALSSRPRLPVALVSGTDKIAHFLAYAVLGACLARGELASRLSPWVAVAMGWLYAASDEWHQAFVPGRSAELADWLADAAGVVAGLAFYHWARRRGWGADAPPRGVQPNTDTP